MRTRVRKVAVLIALLVTPLTYVARAQSSVSGGNNPKELVDEFWQRETKGERLTEDGWNQLTDLSLQPSVFPERMLKIRVISGRGNLEERKELSTDDFAAFWVEYSEYGELDSNISVY